VELIWLVSAGTLYQEINPVSEIWDDFVEVESEYVRYDSHQSLPTDQYEVEKISSMQFHANAVLLAPTDLYAHTDGSTSTRLRPNAEHIFAHSSSSSFFAFLPLSFWRKVVEATNVYGEKEKQPLVTLDEMMKFLGILFFISLVDKGEYSNYWGEQVENVMFEDGKTGLESIMS
jgi:hypothetical protein